jgi:hypothetical protein
VVEEFLKSRREANRSEEYLHDLRCRLNRFAGVFPTAIGDLTRSDVVRFLSTLGLGPRSQFNYCKVLRTFFEFAKTMGYLPRDHNELEALAMGDDDPGQIEIYTPGEMRALLSAAPGELIAPLVLGGFCGLSRAEVEELDWAKVDLAVEVIKPKHPEVERGRPRAVAILPNVAEWLRGRHRAGGPVWPHSGGSLAEALRQAAEQAGVRWREEGLRHSYAGYRLAQVRDPGQVATETGYSPHTLFRTFAELATREEAASWFGIVPATAATPQ